MLPETRGTTERFKPANETVLYLQEIANELYGRFFNFVDDSKEEFTPEEIKTVFENILRSEFDDIADEWVVVAEKANSINVVASEKKIIIPTTRKPVKPNELKKLIVHEIGVHFFRAIMGAQTDIMPLSIGFAGYYEAEEGLGKVMEQAIDGKFSDSGIPY